MRRLSKYLGTRSRSVIPTTLLALSLVAGTALAEEQYFPLQSYRVGPYAAGGTGFFGGMIDYMNLINMRDGGVNGVKLTWSECETGFTVEKGMECYERMKDHVPAPSVWTPLSVGISYAMTDRITADEVPMTTINHGRIASADGRVFPYVFPLLIGVGSEVSGMTKFIGIRVGGMDQLKGKKVAVLYHGSSYGKEANPAWEMMANKYGFDLKEVEVPPPGSEQTSEWLEIKRYKPDFVILRGWGVMNPVAIKTARRTGFPIDHIIGNIWSNSEDDVRPAGEAAKGYIAITSQISGTSSPILQAIIKSVYGAGKGNLDDQKRIGSVYHNLGIVNGILTVEAVRIAQAKFGNKAMTGKQVQWGFEHLSLDETRVAALGAKGLFHSINVTCANHQGDGLVTFQQWDGTKWKVISDWIAPDWKLLRPSIEQAAEAYAKDKNITPRSCDKEAQN